jgi:hypothetical protein
MLGIEYQPGRSALAGVARIRDRRTASAEAIASAPTRKEDVIATGEDSPSVQGFREDEMYFGARAPRLES